MRLSARNQFPGTVVQITDGAVMAEVVVRLDSGEEVVSLITLGSARSLGLAVGSKVRVVVKSTDVMVALDE